MIRPGDVYDSITKKDMLEWLASVGYAPVAFRAPLPDDDWVNSAICTNVMYLGPRVLISHGVSYGPQPRLIVKLRSAAR